MEEEGKAPALLARAAETGESASGRLQCLDVQSLRTLDVGQSGLSRKLKAEELMLLNCGVGEDS